MEMVYSIPTMTTPDPIEVRTLIDEIVDAKETLALLEARWAALFSPKAEPQKGGRKPDPNGVTSRVLAYLEENRHAAYDPPTLSRNIEADKDKVDSALYNLFTAGKIVRPVRGHYQFKSAGEEEPAA
jgi:hypothetical protein